MKPYIHKWTPILELESQWTPKFSKGDCRGQNSLDWRDPYIIGNLLEPRCFKWARMIHLGYLKHKLQPKEGSKVKLTIWFLTTKSQESPWFLACRWHVTYHWKILNKEYNFVSNFISIEGLHAKLWASKVIGVPISRISRFQLGSPETKWHLGVGPMVRHIEYYKEEGGGFPQVWAVVSLVSPCLPMVHPCIKNAPIMH